MTEHAHMKLFRISSEGSERATAGGGGKIVTRDGRTHVVWQDARTEEGYPNRVVCLDRASGELSEAVTLNYGKDNHARPNIVMDRKGFLHALISGHNSPVVHRRSERPNDVSSWSEPRTIGDGTYPIPVCGPDDTLYVTMRSAEQWNGVDLYRKPADGAWEGPTKLVERDPAMPGYAAFHGGLAVGEDGTLHALIDFYESATFAERRGLHQAVTFMRSPDGGATWERTDGTPVALPARPERMSVLARDRARERHESMPPPVIAAHGNLVLDTEGQPHVLYVDHRIAAGQLIHATPGHAGGWQNTHIEALAETFPAHRPTSVRGALTRTPDGALVALLELVPLNEKWHGTLPTRALGHDSALDRRLAWLVSRDGGTTWSAQPALEGHAAQQPNLERPMGGNELPATGLPPFVFFEGIGYNPGEGEVVRNDVHLALTT